ncbi:MAG: transporter-like protein [Acidimicrobiales bacterium]|nr:transporter-like protein [Acidimicrobiales bacterium]
MPDELADVVALGERMAVGANHPIALTGNDGFYVRTGALDIFVQPLTPAGLGKRSLVGTADAGALVWSGDFLQGRPGWRLVAVGRPNTELFRLPSAVLESLAGDASIAAAFGAFVDAAERGAGQRASRPGSDGESGMGRSPAAIVSEATAAFVGLVASTIQAALDEDVAEAQRLTSERQRTRRVLDSALADLVDVVERGEAPGRAPEGALAQLDLALGRICGDLGVEYPEQLWLESGADPVKARVAAAGCRSRIVSLDGEWWKQPWAPLLGFDSADGRPVALIPRRTGHLMFDPSTGSTAGVDRATAGRLAGRAYAVYRPLPAGAASPSGMFKVAVRKLRGNVWLLLALGVLAGLVTLVTPMVTSLVYNSVLPQSDRSLLADVSLLLGGATVTWGLLVLSRNLVLVRMEGLAQTRLEPGVTDRLLRLSSDFFRRYDTGDLATRANGLDEINQELSGAVATSLMTLVFSVFNVALLFAYSALLGVVSLVLLILFIVVLVVLNLRAMRYQGLVYEHSGEIASDLFQMVQGIQKMRVAGAETRFMARWASRYRLQAADIYNAGRMDAWNFALITALPAVLAVALYGTTVTALNSNITGGAFLALLTALGQFTAAITAMALTVSPLFISVPIWRRLLPILEEPVEEITARDPGRLSGEIELRDVSFGYHGAGAPTLRNISLEVRPGEFIAITGPSGAGKSTMLRLLLGLDVPTSGSILYDGKDLGGLDASAVRRQFGVVMQGARPLPGEILSTILGDAPGDEDTAWAAAETAALADDIRRMPMGMHTVIGEGGLAFSGGQLQRMMVARALARKPRLLFFDEATSALDDRAQEAVSQHIEQLQSTRVVIAHRLSTIRHADRIYVLDGGRIVQAGTFDELMAVDGLFRSLTSRQLV